MTTHSNPATENRPSVLATDLDGTLIPLRGSDEQREALQILCAARSTRPFTLVYATGRHHESVMDVITGEGLPEPDWIICDVGTSIYCRENGVFRIFEPYRDHLLERTGGLLRHEIESALASVPSMRLQPPVNQQRFKISYECAEDETDRCVSEAMKALRGNRRPYHVIGSIDPFHRRGLIYALPDGVTKAYALQWLARHAPFPTEDVIYAGDSGNDLAALICGFRAVIVANASYGLLDRVRKELRAAGREERLYAAAECATLGVLEGCRHFGLIT